MREVDRLLTAGLVAVTPTDPDHPHARQAGRLWCAEARTRTRPDQTHVGGRQRPRPRHRPAAAR
jgi:hypothetical protein